MARSAAPRWLACSWCRGPLCIVLVDPPAGFEFGMDTGYSMPSGHLLCKCCDRTHQRWEAPCPHRVVR